MTELTPTEHAALPAAAILRGESGPKGDTAAADGTANPITGDA